MRKPKCPLTRMVCPENSDPQRGTYCPCWWETLHTNVATGEEKFVKSCAWGQLPLYLIEVIKASNRPAAAIESTRNEIAEGLTRVAQAIDLQHVNGLLRLK